MAEQLPIKFQEHAQVSFKTRGVLDEQGGSELYSKAPSGNMNSF